MKQQEPPSLVVHTETIALYSEKCMAYLAQAVKNAESSVEDDFRRFYQASEAEVEVQHSSSVEEGGNEGRASEDEESEGEDELQITETTSLSSSKYRATAWR